MRQLLLLLHLAGVVVWVGGMFFAYVCLRPVAAAQLEAPARLRLWREVLARFFAFVWIAVVLIPVSGMGMLSAVGWEDAPIGWKAMLLLGLLMIAIFVVVMLRPYAALRRAVGAGDWPAAGRALAWVRRLVGTNLVLGAATIVVATLGRLLS